MRNVLKNVVGEKEDTIFYVQRVPFHVVPFLRSCGKNVAGPKGPQTTILPIGIAYWITMATNTT